MIAFERCIAKGLERIFAARLAHLAESQGLLPKCISAVGGVALQRMRWSAF